MYFAAQREDPEMSDSEVAVTSVAGSFSECRAALKNRKVPCPDCGRPLRPRGFARPPAKLRGGPGEAGVRLGPRPRGQCDRCCRSHVLQPAAVAAHRSDALPVLVRALLAFVLEGAGAGRSRPCSGARRGRCGAGWRRPGCPPGGICRRSRRCSRAWAARFWCRGSGSRIRSPSWWRCCARWGPRRRRAGVIWDCRNGNG